MQAKNGDNGVALLIQVSFIKMAQSTDDPLVGVQLRCGNYLPAPPPPPPPPLITPMEAGASYPEIADVIAALPPVVHDLASAQVFWSAKAALASSDGVPEFMGYSSAVSWPTRIETTGAPCWVF